VSEELSDPWDVPESAVAGPGGLGAFPKNASKVRGRRNRFAVAGVACSIAPVLGVAFSIVGLFKSRAADGKGWRLSVAGLVLSVVFAGVYTLAGLSLAYSAAWDDGCRRALGREPSIIDVFERDLAGVRRDSTSPKWLIVLPDGVYGAGADAQGFLKQMRVAESQTSRGDVRADMQRVERDLDALVELSAGAGSHRDWTAAAAGVMSALHQLLADAAVLTSLCGSYMDFV